MPAVRSKTRSKQDPVIQATHERPIKSTSRNFLPSNGRSGRTTLKLSPSILQKVEQSTKQGMDDHAIAEETIASAIKSVHDVLIVSQKARAETPSVKAENSAASAPMSRSESVSTQASSSASTRPQRLRTRTPKAAMADVNTNKPLTTKSGPKKRSASEISHTGAALSSTSIKQTNKKRKLSPQRIGASPSTTSPNDALHESAATSSSPSVRPSPDLTNGELRGGAATSSSPSLQQSPEPSRNVPQLTPQPSSSPQKVSEKPKSGPRIKSYDAALDKAIERADTAERRATEAERRLQELEQDTFARNYESFEGPPTHKYHTAFEKKHQLIRDLQARIEKHEVTIAKKKGEVYAHIAYKKELKASLAEKDKDIKVLKARQDTLTNAVIGRDADIAEKDEKIAALQKQLSDQDTRTPEETDDSKTLKTTHEECNDAAGERDAEIHSLKAMHEGCDEAMESLNARIESLAAQANIDKCYLAQKDELLNIRSKKHEWERNGWMKSCQTHVQALTNSQRVGEDLDAEVKKLRRSLERKDRELADAVKQSEKEVANPQNELQDSETQLTELELAQNLDDLQDEDRKSVATMLARTFVDHAKQAQNHEAMSLLPDQTTDAISLRLGLRVEHAIYASSWGQFEKPSKQYLKKCMAIRLYMVENPELRERLFDGSLLPDTFSKMFLDEIRSKVAVMEALEEQRTLIHSRDSTSEYAERMQDSTRLGDVMSTQEAVRNEPDHRENLAEHQAPPHSVLSESHEPEQIEQQDQAESQEAVRNKGKDTTEGEDKCGEEDEGIGRIPSSDRPSIDSHDSQAKPALWARSWPCPQVEEEQTTKTSSCNTLTTQSVDP